MLGLVFIFVFIIYITVSVWLIKLAMRQAEKRDIEKWKWGVPVGLVMYLIVFWDHMPTLVTHQYYCKTESGFTVYKTLEDWKKENPGVEEKLTYKETPDSEKTLNGYVYHLNERFDWRINNELVFLSVKKSQNKVVDTLTNEVLAEYVDFSSGHGTPMAGYGEWNRLKMWLMNASCERDVKSKKGFYEFKRELQKLGEWR